MSEILSAEQRLLDESTSLSGLYELAAQKDQDPALAWMALRLIAQRCQDYTVIRRAARLAQRLMASDPPRWRRTVRLALLGGFTTAQMPELIRFYLAVSGVQAAIYEAPFGQAAQQLLEPAPDLLAFGADLVLLVPGYRETQTWQSERPGPETVAADVAAYRRLWLQARELGLHPLQHTFDLPVVSPLGNLSGLSPHGPVRRLRELNAQLADAADGLATLIDVERLAGEVGMARWQDERFWHAAKQGVALDLLPRLCRLQASVIKGVLGLSAKVLALDLDNTLWGGVIGEDGLAGIEVGDGTARGEAFAEFQRYCRGLKERGVVLVAVSKNNAADAMLPFAQHPEMILRAEDFALIRANWQPKSENLRSIAAELNLGLDTFVFVDDNPAERAEVRAALPAVEVVDLPEEPSAYGRSLQETGWFEVAAITAEDLQRAQDYSQRVQASDLERTMGSLDDFLAALTLRADVQPLSEVDLPRVHQLFQKTNQFNLTTRRYSEIDLRRFQDSPQHRVWTVRLKDRFGDRGLVGVMVTERRDRSLSIDSWLISCRVLGRTLEAFMLGQVIADAQQHGDLAVLGIYRPTERNVLVRELYAQLGFEPLGTDADGTAHWRLPVGPDTPLPRTFVHLDRVDGP